jgi:hypothetical protein
MGAIVSMNCWPDRSIRRALLVALLVWLAATARGTAQKAPGLGYVFPPVVCAGQSTDVQLGGYDFTTDLEWFVYDDRAQWKILGAPGDYQLPPPPYWHGPRSSSPAMPIPREVAARIEVRPDAPAGLVRWQVANANGSSATALFYVSRGAEIVESRSRDFPQKLASLPVAISGRLSRLTEVDRYEWTADRDGPISIDLMNRRLGADFNGLIEVRNTAGELVADFADTQGVDGGLTFAAQAGSTYTILLRDVDYRGDRAFVYRLAITPGPRVLCTLPAAGERGTTREVEFVGVGITSGKPIIESIRQNVAFPADASVVAHAHRLETQFGTVEVAIPLSDTRQIVAETPPNQQAPAQVTSLDAPVVVTGRLDAQAKEQRYSWNVQKDEDWSVDLQSRAFGGCLDVALVVLGPDGKPLAENDDLPGTTDAGLTFRAAVAGSYTCVVRSITSRSGAADEVYSLQLRRRPPDFALSILQHITLPTPGKAEFVIQATRSGGFDGEIVVTAEGLPPGVTQQGDWTIAAGKNEQKLELNAAAGAAVVSRPIQFVGTARHGDATLARRATAPAKGNLAPRDPASERIPQVMLAMTMPAPFELQLVDHERQNAVHRGATHRAEWIIKRNDGFAGEIQIEMSAQQDRYRQGKRGPIVTVPAGADRAIYPCFMPEWLGTDLTQRIVVHGVGGVKDGAGNVRQLTRAGDARITMIMEGALLKLSTKASRPSIRLGEAFEVPVVISRSIKLPVDTKIELVALEEAAGLLRADPITLPPGVDEGTLRVVSTADARLAGPWTLKLVATALEDDRWPVVSETDLMVDFVER